jgi:hypothetical protein
VVEAASLNLIKNFYLCGRQARDVALMRSLVWCCPTRNDSCALLLILFRWGETVSCRTAAANGHVHPPDDMWVNMERWWNDADRGKPKDSDKKPVPVPLCQQVPHGLLWERTWASDTLVYSRRGSLMMFYELHWLYCLDDGMVPNNDLENCGRKVVLRHYPSIRV